MMTLRILLFSILAALALYVPFYYFAPLYRPLYEHVDLFTVNWWFRWTFQDHNGIQIYIAYVLMFAAIGLTAFFEFMYVKFVSPRAHGAVMAIAAIGCFFFLWTIGFFPPMATISLKREGILFITVTVVMAYFVGRSVDRKIIKALLVFLLIVLCMVPTSWSFLCSDYFYLFAPALRTLKGHALNQSYFQYDHVLSFLAMAWMKFGLALDRFHVLIEFSYLVFFVGIYVMAKRLLLNKQLAFYFIFSLVLIKVYANLASLLICPQVSPLRLDLWLIVLGLAYWRGPQHWAVGAALAFFINFHHAFGMIYSVSYVILVITLLAADFSLEKAKKYVPNACILIAGVLINGLYVSSHKIAPGLNYVKYNIGFMPIDPKSFFWYVPVLVSMLFLLLWKSRLQLPQRYFQTGVFLVFLAIGNLLYFFGRSHENNLINIAAVLWLVFFMLIDMIIYKLPQDFSSTVKKVFIPFTGVLIIGLIAYFYSGEAVERIEKQAQNLPKIAEILKPEAGVDLNLTAIKAITQGNPDIIFLSIPHDFECYYYGGYTPVEFCPLESNIFTRDLMGILNGRLAKGANIIVPQKEFATLIETILLLKAKYIYKISDFVYISNNPLTF